MEALSRLNRSRTASLLVFAAVFALLFFCNHETNLIADDYRYCFSFADDSRVEALAQIFPSMAAHRLSMNGRVIAHFLVQLFLMLPKTVFDLINALFFTALVWLISRAGSGDEKTNALLLLSVFSCLWILQPDFGQVFLWLDGSVNYLWCAVFCLLWLRPWSAQFRAGRGLSKPWQLIYILCSFAVGAYSENSSVALSAMAFCFLLFAWFEKKQRPPLWMPLSLAALLAGFLYMMLAPAESANKSAELRLAVLLANFLETGRFYLRFWPLLLSFGLFFCLERKRQPRLLALVYLFGSLAGHFVLSFAMYTAGRSTYIGLVLLIAANVVLFVPLFETERRRLLSALCAVCVLVTAYLVVIGVKDIVRTHGLLTYNEELILACAQNGEREVQVPRPYAETGYSALEGLAYLNTEDPEDWPNVYMAKYYGIDRIIGY